MIYFYIIIFIAALALIYMRLEASNVEVTHVRFTHDLNCLKIVQLSDIHIGLLKVTSKKVRHILAIEKPDIVVISGDLVEQKHHINRFLKFGSEIAGVCPIYSCFGNHDYEAFEDDAAGLQTFIKKIESLGINVLINNSVKFIKNESTYNIIGIGDFRCNKHDFDKAFKNCDNKALANIGFSHNPDIALQVPSDKLNYLFCGHFHGGQIWMPFDIEYKILRSDKLCKMGIKRGLHLFNGINLYINRGLGNVLFPLRLFSRPEITVFYI